MADTTLVTVTSPLLAWFQHSMVRTVSVVFGVTILLVLPFFAYQHITTTSYNRGMSDYAKAHPQNVYQAPTTQNYITYPPTGYAVLGMSTKNYCFGICRK